jgi:hypothetical protein
MLEKLEAVGVLLRAHYHLMKDAMYWHDKGDLDASSLLCGLALELNKELI